MRLTEDQRWIIINGLETAKRKYQELAGQFIPTHQLSVQFERQAKQAEEMSELIEQADEIVIQQETTTE